MTPPSGIKKDWIVVREQVQPSLPCATLKEALDHVKWLRGEGVDDNQIRIYELVEVHRKGENNGTK